MIELQDLTKIYNPRKKNQVKALNHINLKLDDHGMVFILGKSGSGKSTLLNMLGGLDTFSEGEIIIKGKPSKDLSQSDFDSYRNTFIGFIFQEYNVFNEFTVGKNISIALELQGIKSESKKIEEILRQVDLEGFADRMPNELSTGQKQRVAIARAIVKSPDIILADEPTGALDSTTGKQVLDTLKKLSQEKLVIVITHDREFAEMYGDRIIEISDGQIINDTKPTIKIKSYQSDSFNLIKSKLPIKDAIKMGISNLKLKPIRLIFAILLSAIAFTIFGLTDSVASYNRARTTLTSLNESNINYITYQKDMFLTDSNGNQFYDHLTMKDTDIKLLKQQFPNHEFVPIYKQYADSLYSSLYSNDTEGDAYYSKEITGSIEVTDKLMEDLHLELVVGTLPTNNNEVLISKYIYNHFVQYGYKSSDGKKITISTPVDLVGKSILLEDKYFSISGIIDTKFNEERYKVIIDTYHSDLEIDTLRKELKYALEYGIHSLIYVRQGYFDELYNNSTNEGTFVINDGSGIKLYLEENSTDLKTYFNKVSTLKDINNIHWKDDVTRTKLAENEIIIPISSIPMYTVIDSISKEPLSNLIDSKTKELIHTFANDHHSEIKEELANFYGRETTFEDYVDYIETYVNNQFHEDMNYSYFTYQATVAVIDELLAIFQNLELSRNYEGETSTSTINVVGVYDETLFQGAMDTPLIVSDELYNDLNEIRDGQYNLVLTTFTKNCNNDIRLIKFSYESIDGIEYHIKNEVTSTLDTVNELLDEATKIIFYIGLVIALFASLLLFNFISVSISAKKREIGILRAIGARSKDVFMIFLSQSMVIALINFVIASIGTYILSIYLNNSLREDYNILITILSFSIRQVIVILFVSIFVAYISTFIPVYRFARKKPIDAISISL